MAQAPVELGEAVLGDEYVQPVEQYQPVAGRKEPLDPLRQLGRVVRAERAGMPCAGQPAKLDALRQAPGLADVVRESPLDAKDPFSGGGRPQRHPVAALFAGLEDVGRPFHQRDPGHPNIGRVLLGEHLPRQPPDLAELGRLKRS